ncbi:MAG: hypothetical protein AB7L84_12600 [Acidimicrobiia bacterium]
MPGGEAGSGGHEVERTAVWHVTATAGGPGEPVRFRIEATLDVGSGHRAASGSDDPEAVLASLRVWLARVAERRRTA